MGRRGVLLCGRPLSVTVSEQIGEVVLVFERCQSSRRHMEHSHGSVKFAESE